MTVWRVINGETSVSFDTYKEAVDWYFKLTDILYAGVYLIGDVGVVKYVNELTKEEKDRVIKDHYPDNVIFE